MKKPTLTKDQKKSIASQNGKGPAKDHKPPTSTTKGPSPKEPPKRPLRRIIWGGWKELWAFIGPAIALYGLYNFLMPQIEISAGVNLDATQEMQTQFVVKNIGHIPVYNVRFSCGIGGPVVEINDMETGSGLAPIDVLNTGQSVSRGCFAKSDIPVSGSLEVTATYAWPLVGRDDTAVAYFAVRKLTSDSGKTDAGYILVPDVGR